MYQTKFLTGIYVGSLGSLSLLLSALIFFHTPAGLYRTLENWQTLLGSLIAVAAALIAAVAAWENVKATREASKIERKDIEDRAGWVLRFEIKNRFFMIVNMHDALTKAFDKILDGKPAYLDTIVKQFGFHEEIMSFDFMSKLNKEDYIEANALFSEMYALQSSARRSDLRLKISNSVDKQRAQQVLCNVSYLYNALSEIADDENMKEMLCQNIKETDGLIKKLEETSS